LSGIDCCVFGTLKAVLPDGWFSNQKCQFWKNMEGLGMEKFVIFYDNLKYSTAIWYNLWPFGYSLWSFGIFFTFWYVWAEKNLAALVEIHFSAGTVGQVSSSQEVVGWHLSVLADIRGKKFKDKSNLFLN
jgi:hypothetical protein